MKKILISVVVVAIGLCAYAANWQKINDKIYLDVSGIMRTGQSGSVYSFWTKELNDGGNDFVIAEMKYSQKVWYDLVHYSIDCSSRKFKIEEVLMYGLNNNLITDDSTALSGWHSIPPQSIAEDYLELVCKVKSNTNNEKVESHPAKTVEAKPKTSDKLSFTEIDPNAPAIRTEQPKPVAKTVSPAELDNYMKNLQKKISSNWVRPDVDKSLKVSLVFSIAKEGTLVTLSEFRTSGNKEFDNAASEAIKKSVPFEPLPSGMHDKGIDVQLTFGETIKGYVLTSK